MPSHLSALNAAIAKRCTVSTSAGDNGAGTNKSAGVVDVFLVVVVELGFRSDLARHRCAWLQVAQHRAFDLAPFDRFFDDDPLVVAERKIDRGTQRVDRLRFAHADGRTEVCRFDERRQTQRRDQLGDRVVAEVALVHGSRPHLRNAVEREHLFGLGLVHREGRAEDTRPHVGHARQFEQALDGAVLAEWAVQQRKHDDRATRIGRIVDRGQQIECRSVRHQPLGQRVGAAVECGHRVVGAHPATFARDADRFDVILREIDGREHVAGRRP